MKNLGNKQDVPVRASPRIDKSSLPGLFYRERMLVNTGKRFTWDIRCSSPVCIQDPSLNISRGSSLAHFSRRRRVRKKASRHTPNLSCRLVGGIGSRHDAGESASPGFATPALEKPRRRQSGCIHRPVIDKRAKRQINGLVVARYVRPSLIPCALWHPSSTRRINNSPKTPC